MRPTRVFLLSPARLDGERGKLQLNPHAAFTLARAMRTSQGSTVGEVFTFVSGLYFRGKLEYATAFTGVHARNDVRIITTDRGLVAPDLRVTRDDLTAFSRVDLARENPVFIEPLLRDARQLHERIPSDAEVILLGSIATGKYVAPLLGVFGDRLRFPASFVGRGDMSRGGLLLRSVRAGTELEYIPVAGATRHGVRPPKLEPLR
jgi:hypothetical protein